MSQKIYCATCHPTGTMKSYPHQTTISPPPVNTSIHQKNPTKVFENRIRIKKSAAIFSPCSPSPFGGPGEVFGTCLWTSADSTSPIPRYYSFEFRFDASIATPIAIPIAIPTATLSSAAPSAAPIATPSAMPEPFGLRLIDRV